MAKKSFKRKLTTMLSADVAEYGRLMGQDETGTVKTLKVYQEIMTELIRQHRGRVVDSPGDNVLAEFTSVVDAVQCAVSVQKELQARNAELPEDRKMEFRIGVNLGDVIKEGKRIYGDGVNIAARLEALADPGGICISKTAFDHIETKLPLGYEYLGEQTVKNIAKPVGAYRVLMEPRVTVAEAGKEKEVRPVRRKAILAGGVTVIVVAVAAVIWNFYLRPAPPAVEPASVEKMAHPLPDKPSIVVLPFVNMSGDAEQEYFCDGLTEEIINGLSKIPDMFVIARQSSFSYKGKPVKIQQVAEELGVQYVLEGSVRIVGDRVRVTAQLIDAIAGHHLWSERYERVAKDIFAIQDDITANLMRAMQLEVAGLGVFQDRPTPPLEAYLKLLKGIKHVYRYTKDDNALGRKLYEEAIALDPEYGPAYRLLGWTHWHDVEAGWSKSPDESLKKAEELGQKAASLGDDNGYLILSYIHRRKGQYDKAIAFGEKGFLNSGIKVRRVAEESCDT